MLKISGPSLAPRFLDGDFVLASKVPILFNRVQPGDIVVFRQKFFGTLVKQVERFDRQQGKLFVVGTHPGSVDSWDFGPVDLQDVVGKVVWHLKRA